jgi:hypothetical protein
MLIGSLAYQVLRERGHCEPGNALPFDLDGVARLAALVAEECAKTCEAQLARPVAQCNQFDPYVEMVVDCTAAIRAKFSSPETLTPAAHPQG